MKNKIESFPSAVYLVSAFDSCIWKEYDVIVLMTKEECETYCDVNSKIGILYRYKQIPFGKMDNQKTKIWSH